MSTYKYALHAEHLRRREAFARQAVPDTGIDLSRYRKGVVIRWAPGHEPEPEPALEKLGDNFSYDIPPPVVQPEPECKPLVLEDRGNLVSRIGATVSKYFGIKWTSMQCEVRTKKLVVPRHIAMLLARRIARKSTTQVGLAFGGRDHSTVIHACQKVERRCIEDFTFGSQVTALECVIRKQIA